MKTVIHKSWIGSDPRPPRWDKIPTELLPKICFEAPLIINGENSSHRIFNFKRPQLPNEKKISDIRWCQNSCLS